MRRTPFLFLLAAILISVVSSQGQSVDIKKGGSVSTAPSPSDFAVTVSLLGEKGGVYAPGKEIQISFQTTRSAYVVVYNVDADGYVHLLYPEDGKPVLSEERKTYFLPPPGTNQHWETGGTSGVEYIHALAVTDPGRINEDELYFLSRGDGLSEEKRLHLDMDPFLGFNMIDEELVRDAETSPPVTDYTYFYINKHVDYPRYLCAKCHSPGKLSDPYAQQCPEIVIEKIAYDEDPHYPYPPLYDVRHVGDKPTEGAYSSDSYADKWLDEGETRDTTATKADDTHIYLAMPVGGYYPDYYPYYDGWFGVGFGFGFGFGFGWGWGWWGYGDPYWGYGYYPYYGYGYPYWGYGGYPHCGYGDDYYCGGGGYYPYRSIYGPRNVTTTKSLNYARTNTEINRNRSLAGSRLTQSQNRNAVSRGDHSNLGRMAGSRTLDRGVLKQTDRLAMRSRELERRVIYGGETGRRSVDRTVDRTSQTAGTNRTGRTIDRGSTQRGSSEVGRTTRHLWDNNTRQRGGSGERGATTRGGSQGKSSGSDRHEATHPRSSGSSSGSRSSGATTHGSSGSSGRSAGSRSSGGRGHTSMNQSWSGSSSYQRSWSATSARSYGSSLSGMSRSAASMPTRSMGAPSGGKMRTR